MNIGCHILISSGIDKAPEIAKELGCEAIQIFTRAPQGGKFSPIPEETAKSFRENCGEFEIKNVYVHAPYFINLASKISRIYYGSINSIRKELERASALGAKYVMTHLGSVKDLSEEESFKKITEGMKEIFDGYKGEAKLLMENSAGAGMTIGYDFKQIAKIFNSLGKFPVSGVCLDTQHGFASGYDWKNNFDDCVETLDKNIGVKNIKLIHANDSSTDLNSRKDRHAHIGQGKIGLEGFKKLVAFAQNNDIDMICETAYPEIIDDIKILKEMRNAK